MQLSTQDVVLHDVASAIVTHGYALQAVGYGQCSVPGCRCSPVPVTPWTYTIGLVEEACSEFVVLGANPAFCAAMIGYAASRFRSGDPMRIGRPTWHDGVWLRLEPIPEAWFSHDMHRIGGWLNFYAPGRRDLAMPEFQQVLWADEHGRFPDDPECDPWVAADQVVLATDPYSYPQRSNRQDRRARRISRRPAR
jgi:Domain of unknown function (DUF4262)